MITGGSPRSQQRKGRGAFHVNVGEGVCTWDVAPWGCDYGSMLEKGGPSYGTWGFKWPA